MTCGSTSGERNAIFQHCRLRCLGKNGPGEGHQVHRLAGETRREDIVITDVNSVFFGNGEVNAGGSDQMAGEIGGNDKEKPPPDLAHCREDKVEADLVE
jgi:hypothetical protein